MTRQDFIDNINYWSELLDFCSDEDCDVCEDIYSEDARDDCIDEELVDMARNNNWRDMYNILDSIPDGYDYYRQDNYGDWVGVDDEFDDYKDQVLEWMDDGGYQKPVKRTGKRKTGRAYRRAMNRHKKNRLLKILTYGYHPEAGYTDWDWVDGVFQQVGNHIKYPKNSNRQVYWKRHSNRVIRRYRGHLPKGNVHHKLFDYKYTIY